MHLTSDDRDALYLSLIRGGIDFRTSIILWMERTKTPKKCNRVLIDKEYNICNMPTHLKFILKSHNNKVYSKYFCMNCIVSALDTYTSEMKVSIKYEFKDEK